jgi:electron transfer flavoprotein alpha subunit
MTIISLMKQVPLPSEMRMGEDGLMDRAKAKSIINVDCHFALEGGLQLRQDHFDARMIVCSMGPPSFEVSLKQALAMGYDEAYLLSDRRLGGSDTYATGLALATLLRHLGFGKGLDEEFVLVAGRQTSDGDTAHVPSQVAEKLQIPQATFIETATWHEGRIEARRIIEGGHQMLSLPIPCALSFTPTGIKPRRATLAGAVRSRRQAVTVLDIDAIGLRDEKIGISGSPTIVAKVAEIRSERPPVEMIDGEETHQIVSRLMERMGSETTSEEHCTAKAPRERKRPEGFETVDFRDGARGILTWAEVVGGEIARSSLELLTPARDLAQQLGDDTRVTTLLIGQEVEALAETLIAHGSDAVIVVEDARLAEYRILPFARIFEQVIGEIRPEIALFAATTAGRELAPRIGMKTGSGVTADCTALEIGEHINRKEKRIYAPILESRRPTYGESKLATILGFVTPQISTARAGTFPVPVPDASRRGDVSRLDPLLESDLFVTEILETVRGKQGGESLFEAEIIVTRGRGVSGDGMEQIRELVAALREQGLRAEWACSRPVVDDGAAEYARQIGQTGTTVRPEVYIAIGISGAVQHLAGIKESKTIIAINPNPKAPIFGHVDFGILGRHEDILPELIQRVKGGFTFGIEAMQ